MKYRFTIKPRPHQRRGLRFLLENRGGGLQVPMRWGKTKVAVDFANIMSKLEGVKRVLVVCPFNVMGVWPDQIEANTPDDCDVEWMIVNYQAVYDRQYGKGREWSPVPSQELWDWNADLIVVDESHNLGNPTGVTSRMVYELARHARFRLLMTGTMFHRKPFFVFGQAKIYDPSIFGTSFSAFKQMIAVMGGYGGYEVIRYQNLDWMMEKMRSWVYIEDYVEGEPSVTNVIPFELTGDNRLAYLTMEKDSIIHVKGEKVVSPIVLSRHLRCQQIAGGWVKTETKYRRVGNDLLRVGRGRLQDYWDGDVPKVVVGCQFTPEIADVARAAQEVGFRPIMYHGGITGPTRQNRIRDFQNCDDRVIFVAQMQAAKEGIDLSAADTMLFWSLSPSYVTHDQFSRRIEKYRETRTLMYDYLIPVGTRTEVTYEALQEKEDVAHWLPRNPGRVEAITSKIEETDDNRRRTGRRGKVHTRG